MSDDHPKGVFVSPSFWVCNRVYGTPIQRGGHIYKVNFQVRVRRVLKTFKNTVFDYYKDKLLDHDKIE